MKSFLLSVSGAFAFLFLVGCSKTTLPSSGGGSGGSGSVGEVDDTAGFYVRVNNPDNVTYDIHKAADANGARTDCTAVAGDSLTCIVEAEELDLYHRGMSFQINVPSTMCSYLRESPPYFYYWEPGSGHYNVRLDTDLNGRTGLDCDDPQDGNVLTGAAIAKDEMFAGVATGSGFVFCDTDGDNNWDIGEVTTRDRCLYDYTRNEGPNCCGGKFAKTSGTWNTVTNKFDYVGPGPADWGGSAASCLVGPAMKTQGISKSGYPKMKDYTVQGTGANIAYEVAAPSTLETALLFAANYFSGTTPAPFLGGSARDTEAYYRWQCLNHAEELVAEIKVQVREWNTQTEFNNRQSDWTQSDLIGMETGSFTSYEINDFYDWLDVYGNGTATNQPGGTGAAGSGPLYPFPSKYNY